MFDKSHKPLIGEVEILDRDVRAITAPNASPMTFTGTRSYLVGQGHVALIDPGPDRPAHWQAITAALGAGEQIEAIVVTHSHVDHSPLATRLAREFDVPIYGFGAHDAGRSPVMATLGDLGGAEGIDTDFAPDIRVADGDVISGNGWALEVVHTPGHLSNHIALATGDRLFSGDHVMGWATTLISPPDGDLTAFMASLDRCMAREDRVFYPGHGAPITDPLALVAHIRDHRLARTDQIIETLDARPSTIAEITEAIYRDVDPRLHPAAARNVLAHLIDLYARGRVGADTGITIDARFHLERSVPQDDMS